MNSLVTNQPAPIEDAPQFTQREKKRSGQEGIF